MSLCPKCARDIAVDAAKLKAELKPGMVLACLGCAEVIKVTEGPFLEVASLDHLPFRLRNQVEADRDAILDGLRRQKIAREMGN